MCNDINDLHITPPVSTSRSMRLIEEFIEASGVTLPNFDVITQHIAETNLHSVRRDSCYGNAPCQREKFAETAKPIKAEIQSCFIWVNALISGMPVSKELEYRVKRIYGDELEKIKKAVLMYHHWLQLNTLLRC